jgi:predicted permease
MPTIVDLRYAVRLLLRSPIFSFTSVLSLAVGVAATTAIFSLADALLLRPRSGVTNPAMLVDVGRTTRGESGGLDNFGYPLFAALRDRSTLLESLSATQFGANVMALGDANASERVFATMVSANYFRVVGTRTAAGRFFVAEEDRTPGTHPVAVLAHQFWSRRFNADPTLVGRSIRLNNLSYTVVGVAEPGFAGTTFLGTDLWIPMAMDAHVRAGDRSLLDDHNSVWMTAIGRLKPAVTMEQARQELDAVMQAFMRERNDDRADRWSIAVVRSRRVPSMIIAPVLGFVGILGALTGIVLLIACSNVAAMLLARALERRREVATRLAIGASRNRILGQLLAEGVLLAVLAGLVSLPVVAGLVALLSSFLPTLPIPLAVELRIDPRVMTFALLLAGLTSILFALLPALQATRFDVAAALHGLNATADRKRTWLRHSLVTAQVAMALLLLVAAGLFLRSLQQVATIDTGFNAQNVDLIHIDTRIGGYRTDAEGVRVSEALTEQFLRVPGVTHVGTTRMVPLMSGRLGLGGLRAPGYAGPQGTDSVDADWDVVSPGYFAALELRLTRGRAFDSRDREGSTRVAIVSETMAARLWPGQNPIGRTLIHRISSQEERALEIVGVARSARHFSISEPPGNFIYVPLAQQFMSEITFLVRHEAAGSRIADLRRAVGEFDPNLPVIHTQTLQDATAVALLPQRLAAWIAGSVGTIGLLLAALGLYGITAFAVAQRMREIAVRMALGATRQRVLSLVLRQSGRLAVVGTIVGLALAAAVSKLLESLLVGIGSIDPLAFGAATAVLVGVLFFAAWTPAHRASRMDPMRALRAE